MKKIFIDEETLINDPILLKEILKIKQKNQCKDKHWHDISDKRRESFKERDSVTKEQIDYMNKLKEIEIEKKNFEI